MKTGTPHSNVVKGNAAKPQSALAHDIAFAFVVAVILLVGIGDGALSLHAASAVTSEVEPARPPRETVYFPSQYVNHGRDIPDQPPTF